MLKTKNQCSSNSMALKTGIKKIFRSKICLQFFQCGKLCRINYEIPNRDNAILPQEFEKNGTFI